MSATADPGTPTPAQLLDGARVFLQRPDLTREPVWPRTAALLARQAIEQQLRDYWRSQKLDVGSCPMATQLICLPWYSETDLAARVSHLWWMLSRACHYHAYELAPTASELGRWLDETGDLLGALTLAGRAPPPPPSP